MDFCWDVRLSLLIHFFSFPFFFPWFPDCVSEEWVKHRVYLRACVRQENFFFSSGSGPCWRVIFVVVRREGVRALRWKKLSARRCKIFDPDCRMCVRGNLYLKLGYIASFSYLLPQTAWGRQCVLISIIRFDGEEFFFLGLNY
jgi:hypothetical protein